MTRIPVTVPKTRVRHPSKGHAADQNTLLSQLNIQRALLEQILLCNDILGSDPSALAVQEWKDRIEFLLASLSHVEFDSLMRRQLKIKLLRGTIDFDLPTDPDQQLLVGVTYAEASATPDDDDEKRGIVACIKNMAYYATYNPDGKRCYNAFGDGGIKDAIRIGSKGYGSQQWKRVMNGDALQSKPALEQNLIPAEIRKLKACVQSVTATPGSGRQ